MQFLAGDIHYYRIYPGGMRRRLEYMKAFGVTVLQTYVPGELLKEENTIEIFEQYGADAPFTVPTCTDSILE